MSDSRFAPLFGPGSRAEVPLSGEVNGQLIAGQIDRLLVCDEEVTVLDYKSDRPRAGVGRGRPSRLPAADGGLPRAAPRDLPRPGGTLCAALDGGATADAAGRRSARSAGHLDRLGIGPIHCAARSTELLIVPNCLRVAAGGPSHAEDTSPTSRSTPTC